MLYRQDRRQDRYPAAVCVVLGPSIVPLQRLEAAVDSDDVVPSPAIRSAEWSAGRHNLGVVQHCSTASIRV